MEGEGSLQRLVCTAPLQCRFPGSGAKDCPLFFGQGGYLSHGEFDMCFRLKKEVCGAGQKALSVSVVFQVPLTLPQQSTWGGMF